MAITHKQLVAPQTLTGAQSTLYTVPTGANTQIRAFSAINTTAAPVELQVWLGGMAAANLVEKKTLASGETYLCLQSINQILTGGNKITAQGDGLSVMVSGAEIT